MPPVSALAREDSPPNEDIALTAAAVPAAAEHVSALRAVAAGEEAAFGGAGWRGVFDHLDVLEMRAVRRCSRWTRWKPVRYATIVVNLLGNGWIYPAIGMALALSGLVHAWKVVIAALLSTGLAHALYAVLKRVVGRKRPFERDPALQPLARVLDRYSFPSGHCMTLTAVLAPVVHAAPACWPVAVVSLLMLSWCRLAAAHHYPSDVVAGVAIGSAIAFPLARTLLPV